MGMGAGAAETELTMREEHFKVRAEWDGREVEFFQKDKHQTYKKHETRKLNKDLAIFCEENIMWVYDDYLSRSVCQRRTACTWGQ